jgi:hypothetical protein
MGAERQRDDEVTELPNPLARNLPLTMTRALGVLA